MRKSQKEKPSRSKGIVQYWNDEKGYGLIENEDRRNILVYKKDLDFLTLLDAGDEVDYELENSKQGLKATQVKILKDSLFTTRY